MRRAWVIGSAILGGLIGGILGWSVTVVGCRPDSCWFSAGLMALIGMTVAGLGVGVVMVLVVRSLDEWRTAEEAGREPPSPGCEVPQD